MQTNSNSVAVNVIVGIVFIIVIIPVTIIKALAVVGHLVIKYSEKGK